MLSKSLLFGLLNLLASCLFSDSGLASVFDSKTEMGEHYQKQLDKNRSLLRGTPIYQITPESNNITFAGSLDHYDLTIEGSEATSAYANNLDHHLKFSGWNVAPLIAISIKDFGIGFTAEKGYRDVEYKYQIPSSPYINQTFSKIDYSGLGYFLYFIPKIKKLPKYIITTMTVGLKELAVEHQTMEPRYNETAPKRYEKYRYDVRRIHFGANFGIRLAKRFVIIPWYDLTQTAIGTAKSSDGETIEYTPYNQMKTNEMDAIPQYLLLFKEDQELLWKLEPEKNYGIDIAIFLGHWEIHFGGALGFLGSLNKGSDRVLDNNIFLSASYSIKAR